MVRALRSPHAHWRAAVWRCSRFALVAACAGLLGSCGGGGGGDPQRPGDSAPSGVVAANTATLTWDPVVDPNLVGYRIYSGTSSGMYSQSPGNGLNAGNVTTFAVTGLSSGRHFFVVTAFDTMGNESENSNEVFKDIP